MDNQEDFFDDIISDEAEIDEMDSDDPFDDDESSDDENVEVRTVILFKGDMLALLGLKQSSEAGVIVRVDPRQPVAATQTYDDAAAALKWFNRSLATSKRNGWEVVFDGRPIFG